MRDSADMNFCREAPHCQAMIRGEGIHSCICGCVRFCPMECGTVVQVHIRNLPESSSFLGIQIENSGCCFALPPLLSCNGNALMSVYAGCLSPEKLCGSILVITSDPCSCCRIACGRILPCAPQGHRCSDPRPLFAAPVYY